MFLFHLEVMNKMRQVSITISGFTHIIKQPWRRCDINFIWQFTALSFEILLNLYCKMWKLKSKLLPARCWGSSKEILLIYYFLLPDEGGENKICQYLSFSVYFLTYWLRQGAYHFMDFTRGTRELTQI